MCAFSFPRTSDGISSALCSLKRPKSSPVRPAAARNTRTPLTDRRAAIPNLYAIQTVTSIKAASALNKALPADRPTPLNILLQVNTSGEDAKSGVPPLSAATPDNEVDAAELVQVARYVVTECPRLRLQGLMTIGALEQSLAAGAKENEDFARLVGTRDVLQAALARAGFKPEEGRWGEDGRLLLSMG
ncbi:Proline synthase co-transcribed bacterial -like protein, partial [Trametes pubescens]